MAQSRSRSTDQGKGQENPEIASTEELRKAGLAPETVGTEIVQRGPDYDSEALSNAESWDDVFAILQTTGVEVELASKVLGDGFTVLPTEDKKKLVGKKMALIDWRFNNGNMGDFVSIRAFVQMEQGQPLKRFIINDGSTGIMRQLETYTSQREATGKHHALLVENGLRASEYTYEDPNTGAQIPATTYYLDSGAAE